MASTDTIAKTFALLRMAYPAHAGKHLNSKMIMTQMMNVYGAALQDVSDMVLLAAVQDHVAGSKWWPKASELRERAFGIMTNALELTTAYEAWGLVRRFLAHGRGGPYVRRDKDGKVRKWKAVSALTAKTVRDLGGWSALNNSDNRVADRARFIDCYNIEAARERQRLAMLPEVRELTKRIAGGGVKRLEGER